MSSAPAPLSPASEPVAVPEPARSREHLSRRGRVEDLVPARPRREEAYRSGRRQARLRLRRVGLGSLTVVGILWALGLLLAFLVTVFLAFRVLEDLGVFVSLTEASVAVLGAEAPRQVDGVFYFFSEEWVLTRAAIVGGVLSGALVLFVFLTGVMVNASASLVGGIRLVFEEPPAKRPSRAERRAALEALDSEDSGRSVLPSRERLSRSERRSERRAARREGVASASVSASEGSASGSEAGTDTERVLASSGSSSSGSSFGAGSKHKLRR